MSSRLPANPHSIEDLRRFAQIHGNPVDGETPAGTVNGVNTVFTLANKPRDGTLKVWVDGLRLPSAGWTATITANVYTITVGTAPTTSIMVDYKA